LNYLKQEFVQPQNGESKYDFPLSQFMSSIIKEAVPECNYRQKLHSLVITSIPSDGEKTSISFLPYISCSITSKILDKTIPVTAAWQLICLAAKLFDDVEDGDIDGNEAQTINLATGCIFASNIALEKLPDFGIDVVKTKEIAMIYNRVCIRMCSGQDKDLNTQINQVIPTPDNWLEIARDKSGILFAWSAWAGGMVADLSSNQLDALWEYGLCLGTLIQIADDYNAIWGNSKKDLFAHLTTLPICYAYYVANRKERDLLFQLFNYSQKQGMENAFQKMHLLLSTLGTERFILAAAQIQRHGAIDAIKRNFSKTSAQPLLFLLDRVFPILENSIHE